MKSHRDRTQATDAKANFATIEARYKRLVAASAKLLRAREGSRLGPGGGAQAGHGADEEGSVLVVRLSISAATFPRPFPGAFLSDCLWLQGAISGMPYDGEVEAGGCKYKIVASQQRKSSVSNRNQPSSSQVHTANFC